MFGKYCPKNIFSCCSVLWRFILLILSCSCNVYRFGLGLKTLLLLSIFLRRRRFKRGGYRGVQVGRCLCWFLSAILGPFRRRSTFSKNKTAHLNWVPVSAPEGEFCYLFTFAFSSRLDGQLSVTDHVDVNSLQRNNSISKDFFCGEEGTLFLIPLGNKKAIFLFPR